MKRLDTNLYFSIRTPLARRLFRYADKHANGRRGGIEIDLFTLAFDKLVMRGNYKYASSLMQKLKPAIDEVNSLA